MVGKTYYVDTKDIYGGPGEGFVWDTEQNATEIIRSNKETGIPMALWPPTGDLFGKTAGSQEALEEAVN